VTSNGAPDGLYGYRPAVNAIVNRLKNALASQCLPEPLTITNSGDGGVPSVPCLILATMPASAANAAANEATVCTQPGLKIPDATVLQSFQESQHAAYVAAGSSGQDPSLLATCEVLQNTPNTSCSTNKQDIGWCYVDSPAILMQTGSSCQQEIQFTANSPPNGSLTSLQCLLETGDAGTGGD
jgi:hypothetical protein